MASNKKFRAGPLFLSATLTTNILNPPAASGGVNAGSSAQYILITHLRVLNVNAAGGASATPSLYLGASAGNVAGTQIAFSGVSIPAASYLDFYPASGLRLDAADFLVGGASAGSTLALLIEGEIGVSG